MFLNIETHTTTDFPFGTNGKLMVLGVQILKHLKVVHCPMHSCQLTGKQCRPGPSCSKHRIISLTSSLRGQLVKCFRLITKFTDIFLLKKMREAFAMQKPLTFFQ